MTEMKNQVRIIGGLWRGRKIDFPDLPSIRPTPDRVRETLFNWLTPHIVGAVCLDLFAGSGVLGFEALSRGAKQVTFVDNQYAAIQQIRLNAKKLDITQAHYLHGTVPMLSIDIEHTFDIVFLDPPYLQDLLNPSIKWLESRHYLSQHAILYIERHYKDTPLHLSKHWKILRDKTAGQVHYLLVEKNDDIT